MKSLNKKKYLWFLFLTISYSILLAKLYIFLYVLLTNHNYYLSVVTIGSLLIISIIFPFFLCKLVFSVPISRNIIYQYLFGFICTLVLFIKSDLDYARSIIDTVYINSYGYYITTYFIRYYNTLLYFILTIQFIYIALNVIVTLINKYYKFNINKNINVSFKPIVLICIILFNIIFLVRIYNIYSFMFYNNYYSLRNGIIYNGLPFGIMFYILTFKGNRIYYYIKLYYNRLLNELYNMSVIKLASIIIGPYIAIYGFSWTRYEFRNNYVSNQVTNLMYMYRDKKLKRHALEYIPIIQNQKIYTEPKIYWPETWWTQSNNGYRFMLQGLIEDTVAAQSGEDANILEGIKLQKVDLSNAELSNAKMKTVNFEDAVMDNVKFENAELGGAKFTNASLNNALMKNANMYNAVLRNTKMTGAKFSKANMDGATLKNAIIEYATFDGANIENAIFENAICKGTNFSNAKIKNASFENADVNNAYFFNADITNADYKNANLSNTEFNIAKMNFTDFRFAKNIENAKFMYSEWWNALFTRDQKRILKRKYQCKDNIIYIKYRDVMNKCPNEKWYKSYGLVGANLSGTKIRSDILKKTKNLSYANIILTVFFGISKNELESIDFSHTNWWKARFEIETKKMLKRKYKCTYDCPSNEWYESSDIVGGNFTNDVLYGADLTNIDFKNVNIDGTIFDNAIFLFTDLRKAKNWKRAKFHNTKWWLADLVSEQKKWLRKIKPCENSGYLYYYTRYINNCPLNIWYESEGNIGQNYSDLDLSNKIFRNEDYSYVVFYKTNLTNVDLSEKNIDKANFTLSNLTNTNLINTNIENAIYDKANWWDANITDGQRIWLEENYPCNENIEHFKTNWNEYKNDDNTCEKILEKMRKD